VQPPFKRLNADVPLTTFCGSYIVPVQARREAELLLREPRFLAELAKDLADGLADARGGRHPAKV
jgi:hypothetical protein